MNVLSLFDGISCGKVALERAGIKVDRYCAYEIEKRAIQVSVIDADFTQFNGFDLLIGELTCQDLSVYKYDRGDVKGLEGKKSNLFFHFVRAFKETQPKYFLLENVPMEKQWEDVITEELGVNPIMINSNLLGGADRKRLYWTNIPHIAQPEDKGILLKDIALPPEDVDPNCISDSGRYTAIGNGWTVDVIAHIFKSIPTEQNGVLRQGAAQYDDYVLENGRYWVAICGSCAKEKYTGTQLENTPIAETCGISGCKKEATYYVDL